MTKPVALFLLLSIFVGDASGQLFRRRAKANQCSSNSVEVTSGPTGDVPEFNVNELTEHIVSILVNDPRLQPLPPAVDYDRINQLIAQQISLAMDEIIAKIPQPTPKQDISHFVVIAPDDAPYQKRLREAFIRARKHYHRIAMTPPPKAGPPIGALPQVVEYKNSIKTRSHIGPQAWTVLARLERGSYPK